MLFRGCAYVEIWGEGVFDLGGDDIRGKQKVEFVVGGKGCRFVVERCHLSQKILGRWLAYLLRRMSK